MKTVGALITEGLDKKGWSASFLASKLNVSPTHINNLKNDKHPSAKTGQPRYNPILIDRIARALEIPLPVLRSAAGLASPESQEKSNPDFQKLVAYFGELDQANQRVAIGMVEILWREQRNQENGTSDTASRLSSRKIRVRKKPDSAKREAQNDNDHAERKVK